MGNHGKSGEILAMAGSAASTASPHPSIKEAALRAASTKGGGCLRRPPPFVDSFMDGCREAVEAAEAAEAAKT